MYLSQPETCERKTKHERGEGRESKQGAERVSSGKEGDRPLRVRGEREEGISGHGRGGRVKWRAERESERPVWAQKVMAVDSFETMTHSLAVPYQCFHASIHCVCMCACTFMVTRYMYALR